jgi:hypothetical protein
MIVYLLEIKVSYRNNRLGLMHYENDWNDCDAFANLEGAVSAGKERLRRHLQEIRKCAPYGHILSKGGF